MGCHRAPTWQALEREKAMKRLAAFPSFFAAFVAAIVPGIASAQQYPAKPIRIVEPYSSGSGPDAVMRILGDKLSRSWGQQVIIENRPGANGFIAIGEAKKAAPDGYTLLAVDNTHMALQPHVFKQLPYDPNRDFEPVGPVYWTHFFIVVPADSKWKTVADLVNDARSKKGDLTYGSWGIGSVAHAGSAMFESGTGAQMTHVPFKEMGQVYTAVGNGDVAWAFGTAATAGPMYRAKKVRFLAIAAPKRLPEYPDVPTVSEAGGPPGFEVRTWVGLFAPKGTPKPIVERINAEIAKVLADKEVKDRLGVFGFEPYIGAPGELTKAIDSDSQQFSEVVKRARISLD